MVTIVTKDSRILASTWLSQAITLRSKLLES